MKVVASEYAEERLCGVQELYRWPSVAEAGRRALGMRYQLLPYIYRYLCKRAVPTCDMVTSTGKHRNVYSGTNVMDRRTRDINSIRLTCVLTDSTDGAA